MAANEDFAHKSARARELSADTYVDAAIEEAHTTLIGKIESTKETKDGTFAESRIADLMLSGRSLSYRRYSNALGN